MLTQRRTPSIRTAYKHSKWETKNKNEEKSTNTRNKRKVFSNAKLNKNKTIPARPNMLVFGTVWVGRYKWYRFMLKCCHSDASPQTSFRQLLLSNMNRWLGRRVHFSLLQRLCVVHVSICVPWVSHDNLRYTFHNVIVYFYLFFNSEF